MKSLKVDEIWKIIINYRNRYKVGVSEFSNIDEEQLLEIHRDGLVEIGAHTLNHPILSNESDERSEQEILNSINELELLLGSEISSFAYPNGTPNLDFGKREILILQKTNCKIAFSTEAENLVHGVNKFSIPRFGLSHGSQFFIKTKLSLGKYWEKLKILSKHTESLNRGKIKSYT